MSTTYKLIQTIRERCANFYNCTGFMEQIMMPVKDFIPHDASGLTYASGAGFDPRAILYGYPQEFLIEWFNQDALSASRWAKHLEEGAKNGYHTFRASETENYQSLPEYKKLHHRFGFKDALQTTFFDEMGSLMGIYACNDASGYEYSREEQKFFHTISPYIFYAFRRYRWLRDIDFFVPNSMENQFLGIIISDDRGRVQWSNEMGKHILKKCTGSIPSSLTPCLKEAHKNMEKTYKDRRQPFSFLYRDVFTYCPYGKVITFNVGPHGKMFLPTQEEGIVFFIGTKNIDRRLCSILSNQEIRVLSYMAKGLTDKEISGLMEISIRTVQNYANSIFKKFKVSNRTEAAIKAVRLGII